MMWNSRILAVVLAISSTTNAIGLHGAFKGLLQVTPSFSGDGVTLHPGLHPDHDPDDFHHLRPKLTKNLYYSQEGHRPALHGAKHASLDATFVRKTVVLDHSSHIKSVACNEGDIQVCFENADALKVVGDSWSDEFNLMTYHVGCGDVVSGKRSFFHASQPMIFNDTMCAVIKTVPIDESQGLDSGVVTWGTYESPDMMKRAASPAKGHVRVSQPSPNFKMYEDSPGTMDNVTGLFNVTAPFGNGTMDGYEDISTDPNALYDFFNDTSIDTSDMAEEEDFLDLLPMDGDLNESNATEMGGTVSTKRSTALVERGIFSDIWSGLKSLANKIVNLFRIASEFVSSFTRFVIEVAVITAKLIMVPFGVPFEHSIHYDVAIDKHLDASVSNKPPQLFGIGNGFTLAKTVQDGVEFTVQCAKCGISANFAVNGRLAFSISQGVTEGFVEFVNINPFTLDAIFGISLYGKLASKTWSTPLDDQNGKQLQAFPFSPLTIPGILTLGPQLSVSVAFTATLEGKLELLVGGSFQIAAGSARASVKDTDANGFTGLDVKFTPVFRANGTFTATADLGLPIALECGIDVLNGKFKKTVGLIDTPSVYLQAIANRRDDGSVPCNDGVELRIGVKNRIHVAALDLWDYDLRDDVIYETAIGCVTAEGFSSDPSNVNPDKNIITDVIKKSNGEDVSVYPAKLNDVSQSLNQPKGQNAGFRLVMDRGGDSILVSGQDGFVYLVDRTKDYDLSAPWGTTDLTHNTLMLDVFGRLVAYKGVTGGDFPTLAEIRVVDPKQVPVGWRASAIAEMDPSPPGIQSQSTDRKLYSVPYVFADTVKRKAQSAPPPIAYPTFCKTDKGLRLFTTRFLFNENGNAMLPSSQNTLGEVDDFYREAFEELEIDSKSCRTIQLTSETS